MTDMALHPSRLTLGTAQLGLRYGIANQIGKPDAKMAKAILDRAQGAGFTTFDTARAYGDAENRLGAWLAESDRAVQIVSKFQALSDDATAAGDVRRAFNATCTALGRSRIDAYLAHSASDLDRPGVAALLRELCDAGRLGAFGASVYTVEQGQAALAVRGLSVVQAPVNIFNWSFADSGMLATFADASVTVFARSIFVQGLIFMIPAEVPEHLASARTALAAVRNLAVRHGLTPGGLALGAVLSRPDIASAVVGAETPDQVSDLAAMAQTPVDDDAVEQAISLGRAAPAEMFDPSTWPTD